MRKTLAVLGAGNMGLAITDGILLSGCIENENITLVRRNIDALSSYRDKGVRITDSIRAAALCSDVLILALKPQMMDTIYNEIADICKGKLVISIAAGIKIDTIESALPGAFVVRTMPNTPLTVMEGVTHICRSKSVNDKDFAFAKMLFECAGSVFECKEEEINALTALTSSAVAYFAKFESHMLEWAKNNGLSDYDEKAICDLISKTMLGSARLMLQKSIHPECLVNNVTSPKGTTEKALDVFQERELSAIFADAMTACVKRAEELSYNK